MKLPRMMSLKVGGNRLSKNSLFGDVTKDFFCDTSTDTLSGGRVDKSLPLHYACCNGKKLTKVYHYITLVVMAKE